jgi:chorismate mutase/prephenate dehydratase
MIMELEDLREQIDKIDDEITSLFKKRLEIVKEVGEKKKQTGKAPNDPDREKNILLRVTENATDVEKMYLKRVFENIFEISKAYQTISIKNLSESAKKIEQAVSAEVKTFPVRARVACQGIKGAYSGIAADKLFEIADVTYFKTFEGVFSAVEKGLCKYGVLPIENSTAGSVNEVYDLMREHNFYVVKSIRVPITHNLVALEGASISSIKEVLSHEQALTQCKRYLEKMPLAKVTPCSNTAVSAKTVLDSGRVDLAAICSRESAEAYGLKILDSNIQDSDGNYTRFIVITKDLEIYKGANKISVMTTLPHTPGSLYKTLAKLYNTGINVTKLESRPIIGSNFEFTFYFDFECDIESPEVLAVISELDHSAEKFTFLGAYAVTI